MFKKAFVLLEHFNKHECNTIKLVITVCPWEIIFNFYMQQIHKFISPWIILLATEKQPKLIYKRCDIYSKQPSCKKGCGPTQKGHGEKSLWWPRNGSDGESAARTLITTIHVNLVQIPSEAGMRQHKFTWII